METQSRFSLAAKGSLTALLVLLGLLQSVSAALYTVGGEAGWVEIAQGSTAYNDQFRSIQLAVGDQLLFPYAQGTHNVYRVTAAEVASCDGTNPITRWDNANPTVNLNASGYWGFICQIPGHCTQGAMHLAVNVSAAAAPTAAPSTAPVPAPASPTNSTPAPTPSTPAPAPSTPAPTPSTPAPTPPSPAPTPSAPVPTPSATPSLSPSATPSSSPSSSPTSPSTPDATSPSEGPAAEGPGGEGGSPGNAANALAHSSSGVILAAAVAGITLLLV